MASATISKQDCLANCQECQTTLNDMLTSMCLQAGGAHVEPTHVKLMLDCVAACATCVDFMSRNSDYHKHYCRACAEICKACGDNCEQVGDMQDCVDCCRKCEESCAAMAS